METDKVQSNESNAAPKKTLHNKFSSHNGIYTHNSCIRDSFEELESERVHFPNDLAFISKLFQRLRKFREMVKAIFYTLLVTFLADCLDKSINSLINGSGASVPQEVHASFSTQNCTIVSVNSGVSIRTKPKVDDDKSYLFTVNRRYEERINGTKFEGYADPVSGWYIIINFKSFLPIDQRSMVDKARNEGVTLYVTDEQVKCR